MESKQINIKERAAMVRAMDMIVRCEGAEEIDWWLSDGVEDGYFDSEHTDEEICEDYGDDKTFGYLMHIFLRIMKRACGDAGLYCDGVSDHPWEW